MKSKDAKNRLLLYLLSLIFLYNQQFFNPNQGGLFRGLLSDGGRGGKIIRSLV